MTYSLITEFTGSSLFPTRKYIDREDFETLAEKTYILILALRIALGLPSSKDWAEGFLKHTLWNSNFRQWRSNGSDLYVALWALTTGEYEAHAHEPDHISEQPFVRWMRAIIHDHDDVTETRRLFLKMDSMLHNHDSSLRSIRRLVQEWPDISHQDRQLAVTRLLQIMRSRTPRAEAIKYLTKAARAHNLELKNVCNKETGHGCERDALPHPHDLFPSKPAKEKKVGRGMGFLAGLAGLGAGMLLTRKALKDDVNENATAGSTSAASVAAVPGGIGAGFDPNGHQGIYDTGKKKKPNIIKR